MVKTDGALRLTMVASVNAVVMVLRYVVQASRKGVISVYTKERCDWDAQAQCLEGAKVFVERNRQELWPCTRQSSLEWYYIKQRTRRQRMSRSVEVIGFIIG